jgi:MoaA/NifB/PqqE/SkfB family radical SAM enzyme
MPRVVTIDFHVTCECEQECPYCWGPQGFDPPVDRETALAIVEKVRAVGARRIVFTGGDPLKRPDIGDLVERAHAIGLEVAVSTTGDQLTPEFLAEHAGSIELISLPLDGSCEEVSSRTKKEGHFTAILRALQMLAGHPAIDVKIATPVTRHNLGDVPGIVRLLAERAGRMENRFFYNVFQAFPRSMNDVDWRDLTVSDDEFAALRARVEADPPPFPVHWLDHGTLDRLYVMIFPNGSLTVPSGPDYLDYGPFLEIDDLDAALTRTDFDSRKHVRHSQGWSRRDG